VLEQFQHNPQHIRAVLAGPLFIYEFSTRQLLLLPLALSDGRQINLRETEDVVQMTFHDPTEAFACARPVLQRFRRWWPPWCVDYSLPVLGQFKHIVQQHDDHAA
jgi:hypothetical protein